MERYVDITMRPVQRSAGPVVRRDPRDVNLPTRQRSIKAMTFTLRSTAGTSAGSVGRNPLPASSIEIMTTPQDSLEDSSVVDVTDSSLPGPPSSGMQEPSDIWRDMQKESKVGAQYITATVKNRNCHECVNVILHGDNAATCKKVLGTVDSRHVCKLFQRKAS